VEILREGDVDQAGGGAVQFEKVTPTHLDFLLGQKILANTEGWQESLWGPNGEWLGPHGILFVWEGEYPDDLVDDLFAKLEAVRSGPPLKSTPEVVQPIGDPVAPVLPGNAGLPADPDPGAPRPEPAAPRDPRDKDGDGKVSKQERREGKHHAE